MHSLPNGNFIHLIKYLLCNLEKKFYFENARRWKDEAGSDRIQDALSSPHLTKTKLNFINIEHR